MKDFPKRHSQIQDTETGDCAADPARSNHRLQTVKARLPSGVQKKIVVSPVTQPEKSLWDPRQQSKNDADLQAENDIKNYAQFRRHLKTVYSLTSTFDLRRFLTFFCSCSSSSFSPTPRYDMSIP